VLVSHLHVDHYGGLPQLILDGQFNRRVASPTGRAALSRGGPPSRDEAIDRCELADRTSRWQYAVQRHHRGTLLAVALIRLRNKLAIEGVDLGAICPQRLEMALERD
jgi:ribonuclease BN (tRNA processing enzyme)